MDTAARGEKRPATEDAASQPVDKKPTTNYFGISHLLNMLPSDETFKVVTDIHTRCNGDIRGLHLKAIEHPLEDVP